MKKHRYILVCLLSLFVMHLGIGMSVIRYCCAGCEDEGCCQTSACTAHEGHRHANDNLEADGFHCHEDACSIAVYKPVLIDQSVKSFGDGFGCKLLCGKLPEMPGVLLAAGQTQPNVLHNLPPPHLAVSSRYYLALYSVLVI